jgi:hypothetical protein
VTATGSDRVVAADLRLALLRRMHEIRLFELGAAAEEQPARAPVTTLGLAQAGGCSLATISTSVPSCTTSSRWLSTDTATVTKPVVGRLALSRTASTV